MGARTDLSGRIEERVYLTKCQNERGLQEEMVSRSISSKVRWRVVFWCGVLVLVVRPES